ncbi:MULTISPECIES: PAS domain-containing sensor histidine kinase [unclassified Rhizobium]|uniref:hybrid sensor histidine kinase/response regulator n=1 Tax=unclassified Rhizobium TaxID=2613769 RepID=UPI0009E716FD|nr:MULTISPECIES: PAS domain-containing sensor histidine kinase [unclassified Rhizobium]
MGVATITDRVATVLVLAPAGRDAQIAASLLAEAGMTCLSAESMAQFVERLGENIAFGVLTEEALRSTDLKALSGWISAQPSWSDLPFIVLTQRGGGPERNPAAARLSEVLGNVSFIERPFHATTFISVARTAMRGRRRQFDAQLRMQALDDGERRLATALEAGRLGAWEFDLATEALTTSVTCRSIFGRGADDTLSYDELISTIHPEDRERMIDAVRHTIETGQDYAIEYKVVWPDGSLHWAEIRAQVYRDGHGRPVKLVGVSADITERRRLEEQQRQINETLEDRVTKRTAELEEAHAAVMSEVAQREKAEEQLRQALKMEAIGQLTGGVAHDFNNLLMAVLGNLELLRKHVDGDAKAVRLIDGAVQGARRGASLTQRLLAFARRQDLQVGPVDLHKLVTEMEDLLRRSVGSAITLQSEITADLPPAEADSNQLELALLNLVVNARDAMPDGGTITIRLDMEDRAVATDVLSAGRYLVLSVTDTGTGMDAETLRKAIDPFFSTKELGKGTGLGLSMIHGLAIQLKGALQLSSRPGQGTTAVLRLPVAKPSEARETAFPPEVPSVGPSQDSGSLRILMVDDDALIAMSTVDMLEDLGHSVVEANSGRQALGILEGDDAFDLMITDFSMPGMNGAELARKALAMRPHLKILIATGYAELPAGTELNIPRLGKPYSQDQLATEIGKIVCQS